MDNMKSKRYISLEKEFLKCADAPVVGPIYLVSSFLGGVVLTVLPVLIGYSMAKLVQIPVDIGIIYSAFLSIIALIFLLCNIRSTFLLERLNSWAESSQLQFFVSLYPEYDMNHHLFTSGEAISLGDLLKYAHVLDDGVTRTESRLLKEAQIKGLKQSNPAT